MTGNQCPLCGKPIDDEHLFCSECDENAKSRSSLDISPEQQFSEHFEEKEPEEEVLENFEETTLISPEEEQPSTNTTSGKSHKKLFILFFLLLIILVGAGVSYYMKAQKERKDEQTELNFWYDCIEENTPLAYSKYLLAYPEGKFQEEAQFEIAEIRKEEEKMWENLKKSQKIDDYYSFLSVYPETPYKNEILHILDSLSWGIAVKNNTADSYLTYLNNSNTGNITGYYRSLAQQRYDYLSKIVKLEGIELDSVKNVISLFYNKVSEQKFKELPVDTMMINYYGKKQILPEEIGKSIQAEMQKNKIKNISFVPDLKSVAVLRDSASLHFVNLTLSKKINYISKKKKPDNVKESLRLELTPELKIRALYIND